MINNQGPGASEVARQQLYELEQMRDRLSREAGRLEAQVFQLQSQIARYEDQARAAQTANSQNLLALSLERLAVLRQQLASAQAHLNQLSTHQERLARQRDTLLTSASAFQPSPAQTPNQPWGQPTPYAQPAAPPWLPAPTSPHKSRLWLWFAITGIALIVCVAFLGVAQLILLQLSGLTGPGPASNQPFYTPSGAAPDNARCLADFHRSCYSPQDIQQAFSLNPLYRKGDTGAGQTIVLIGAGNTSHLQTNLQTFDHDWGLPAVNLTILQPDGPPAPYTCAGGFDDLQTESTLDVEWAHAIAPGAKIVLVIGSNNSHQSPQNNCFLVDLEGALTYAVQQSLGNIISLSFGGSELGDISETSSEKAGDLQYVQNGHDIFQAAISEGITILAATGDNGVTNHNGQQKADSYWNRPNVSWPASDPDVLAVGGTALNINATTSAYLSETTWNDNTGATGGGLSSIFAEPTYQKSLPDQTLLQGKRGIPDIAFPAEDLLIYELSAPETLAQANPQWQHWGLVAGTSVSTPCWAGLIAIANQLRGKPLGLVQPALYRLAGKDMRDITVGNNTYAGVSGYQAQQGYDLVSGWGTPIASAFLPALADAANHL